MADNASAACGHFRSEPSPTMPNTILNESLEARLRRVEAEKAGTYDKRTEHLDAAGKALFINRLILEDSPYLLQHAHNPVNWFAWGDEAFAEAKAAHKPIFLSIGYSTCHWCHVMEVESFDNVEVAALLNAHFICIKLDREQFPDIDEVYMTGVQIMSGQGGWPMSNFLLPDGHPFFGATYFPAAAFMQLLRQNVDAWQNKYQELEASATQIASAIERILSERKAVTPLDPQLSETMLQAVLRREDRHYGGLAGAPKFPQEPLLLFMLDRVRRQRELTTLAFVERALAGMAAGGIYDQVAGGFHRYSVDAEWLVPHFEKMLYNQSQLGLVYLQAWQLTRNSFLRRVCEQTLNYVVRDMQIPEGGFYSATDADSEGEEGTFFTWSIAELTAALQPKEMDLMREVYDLQAEGNFAGSNILSLQKSLGELAAATGNSHFYSDLDAVLHKLYEVRERRIHPLRDDKLIVAWTGAMITTLVRAADALENESWLHAAERAVELIWKRNIDMSGPLPTLRRIYLDGAVSISGQLEDYVNLVEALLVLFDVTAKVDYLNRAGQLMSAALTDFWDAEGGSFYLSPVQSSGPQLTRSRSASDGATLSPVATALHCLVELRRRSALLEDLPALDPELLAAKIQAVTNAQSSALNDNPLSHPSLLRALTLQKEAGIEHIQYVGNGLGKVTVRRRQDQEQPLELLVQIQLQPGWHVTAPQAGTGSFVPLQVAVDANEAMWKIGLCAYPPADSTLQGDAENAVPIYTNATSFSVALERTAEDGDALVNSVGLTLQVQLCNDRKCLLPERLRFRC